MKLPFSVEVNITREELHTFFKSFSPIKFNYYIYIAVGLVLFNTYRTSLTLGITFTVLALAFVGISIFLQKNNIKQLSQKHYDLHKADFQSTSFSFSEEGIEIKNASATTTTNWAYLSKVELKADLILLYNQKNEVHIIPKRCFPSDQAAETFVETINDLMLQSVA